MDCFLFYCRLNNGETKEHTLFVRQPNRKYDVDAPGYFNILFRKYAK